MRLGRSNIVIIVLLAVVGFLVVYPLFMVVYGSFWSGSPIQRVGHFGFQGYAEAFSRLSLLMALGTTFWLGALRTVLCTVVGIVFAWLLARTDMPMRGPLEVMLWVGFFLPSMSIAMAWVFLLDPTNGIINKALVSLPFIDGPVFNIYSYGGIIWAHIMHGVSAGVLMITPAFRQMDASLEESSHMAGSSKVGTLFRITIPLLAPAILGSAMLGFIRAMESFEIELLLGFPAGIFVYATKIFDMVRRAPPDYPPAMALTVTFMVMVFVLAYFTRRATSGRSYATVSGKGFMVRPTALGRWGWVCASIVLLYFVVTTLLPMAMLALGTFMKVYGGFWSSQPYTLDHWRRVLGGLTLLTSLRNSLLLGAGVAVLGVTLYTMISYVAMRTKIRGRGVLDFLSWLPWAVPGIVISLAILWAYVAGLPFLAPLLYGSIWLMIIAIMVKEMPLGVRLLNGTLVQISRDLEESSWVHGGSMLYTFRRIMAPLLAPAFISTAVMIFLVAVRDSSVVVLLYSANSRPLSMLMLEYWLGGYTEEGAVISLMLAILVTGIAILARTLGLRVRGLEA